MRRSVDVTIRTARADDLDALRAIFRRSSLSNEGDREALLAHPEVLVWPGDGIVTGRTRVAVVDDEPAGFATCVPDGDALELDDLFVDPDRMRQGIARALVADALDAARRDGSRGIGVVANGHALAFYRAVGFTETGTEETLFGPAVRMWLVT